MRLSYSLSNAADLDLSTLYDYTLKTFGPQQAHDYLNAIEAKILLVCDNPKLGRPVPLDDRPYFYIVHEAHFIIYRILSHEIRVIRIFPSRMDITKLLDTL